MDNRKALVWLCSALVGLFSGVSAGSTTRSPKAPVILVRRTHGFLCGYDSTYVLLRLFNRHFDERRLRDMIYGEDGEFSSLKNIKRVVDSSGLYSLAVKGQKWHKIIPDVAGIGYRRNIGQEIGDFYVFEKRGEKMLLFLPPKKVLAIEADEFITRKNRGHALLVFASRWQKYLTVARLLANSYLAIFFAGAVVCVCLVLLKVRTNKKRTQLACGGVALSSLFLILLCIVRQQYTTPVNADELVVMANNGTIDLGCAYKGNKKDFGVPVKNVSEKTITIDSIKSSCSCLSLHSEKGRVRPNRSFKVKGTYSYPASGARNAYIYVVYNDGKASEKIYVKGRNCKKATVSKLRLYFDRVPPGESASNELMFRCFIDKYGNSPRLKEVRTSAPWLTATAEEIQEEGLDGFKSYRISVSVSGDTAPRGSFEEKVYISLDDPDSTDSAIDVYGEISS